MSVYIAGDLACFHIPLSSFAGEHGPTILDPRDNSTDLFRLCWYHTQKSKPFAEPYRRCELLSSECNSSRLFLHNLWIDPFLYLVNVIEVHMKTVSSTSAVRCHPFYAVLGSPISCRQAFDLFGFFKLTSMLQRNSVTHYRTLSISFPLFLILSMYFSPCFSHPVLVLIILWLSLSTCLTVDNFLHPCIRGKSCKKSYSCL